MICCTSYIKYEYPRGPGRYVHRSRYTIRLGIRNDDDAVVIHEVHTNDHYNAFGLQVLEYNHRRITDRTQAMVDVACVEPPVSLLCVLVTKRLSD